MVKFLSGTEYDGTRVPVCTYWREDVTTSKAEDFAPITSEGVEGSSCIANAYFSRSDITCFNEGRCNDEGKCVPCTKYSYNGMRLAISHSPPLTILKEFQKGVSDADLQSPNILATIGTVVSKIDQDQIPYHIVIRNIQAQIAKCCHWNAGDGLPGKFFLTTIKNGNSSRIVTTAEGETLELTGIIVTNSAFPDSAGSFFPVGTVVVAGFEDQPSFYLEPKTGLLKPGEGIIFNPDTSDNIITRAKQTATEITQPNIDAVNAILAARGAAQRIRDNAANFYNNALQTNDAETINDALAKSNASESNLTNASAAYTAADILGNTINNGIGLVINSSSREDVETNSKTLADNVEELAALATQASAASAGTPEGNVAGLFFGILLQLVRRLRVSAFGAFSKCEFFYDADNRAKVWNSPEDGSLPCNGVRTECQFYTGPVWQYATDERLEVGRNITAEQLQEVRYYSDDWTRYPNPSEEFETRFSTPYIWAFKGYVDVGDSVDLEDMLLYRPRVLFGRDTPVEGYDTVEIEKVEISNFDPFEISKTRATVKPGSPAYRWNEFPPDYPTLISRPSDPSNARLRITHPRFNKETETETADSATPFILRSWSESDNKLFLMGTATPDSTVYLINETALQRRDDYHSLYGSKDFIEDIPRGIPGTPDFTSVTVGEDISSLVDKLRSEQSLTDSAAPVGFSEISVSREGVWVSAGTMELVHNSINRIYAFIILSDSDILVDYVDVDFRLLHSIITQTSFQGSDFTISDTAGSSKLGNNSNFTSQIGQCVAVPNQIIGAAKESVSFSYGYYAWRFIDRGLRAGTFNLTSDLISAQTSDSAPTVVVIENDANAFVVNVSYQVVQYRKTITLNSGWYVLNDCSQIMVPIPDINVHRVLPLPTQEGVQKALSNVLVNLGGTGSTVAQWAIESAFLITGDQRKRLVQHYRESNGNGLPANYVVLQAAPEAEAAFGRPIPGEDSIEITFTFLRPQTANPDGTESDAELDEEVVTLNFNEDTLRQHDHTFSFSSNGVLTAGGTRGGNVKPITGDQQDYIWIFSDSEGRPIGRKYSRLMVAYYNLSCISVEIFYAWSQACTSYALYPDLDLRVGTADGTLTRAPKATVNPEELDLGSRVAGLLGQRICEYTTNCGDHEVLTLGPPLREFEVIYFGEELPDGTLSIPGGKAYFPSAGQAVPEGVISARRPGEQWLRRRGPLWYPYTTCESPRYNFNTNGPLHTDSSELINEEIEAPGISSAFLSSDSISALGGSFGNLMRRDMEAYRGPDRVTPKILDYHPDLNNCSSAYTYGNLVLDGDSPVFAGYARRRGEVDLFWYKGLSWTSPPFGNFGRPRVVFEVSEKRGDYLGGATGDQISFRWMPMFPLREDMAGNSALLSEELESQHYRLTCTSNPLGPINENVVQARRFTHKALIANRNGAGVEYPYSPYWPQFLPDASLGLEPFQRSAPLEEGIDPGPITTMWAWRERPKKITRGVSETAILKGIKLELPDFVLDNRRMETRIQPPEGAYELKFVAPVYDEEGNITENATLTLGSGPPREILIDFKNQKLEPLYTPDTVYDTSKILGDAPFPCVPNTRTDNLSLAEVCSCEGDVTDPAFTTSNLLPARFVHLDDRAADGQFGLYSSAELSTPIARDLIQTAPDDPCCVCEYYIPGIFCSLDYEFIPTTTIDPVFDSRVEVRYAWSRVPHGNGFPNSETGIDGIFNANESLGDQYQDVVAGSILINRFPSNQREINDKSSIAAFFPSPVFIEELTNPDNEDGPRPIEVLGILPPGDPRLKGGVACTPDTGAAGFSNGQSERIIMDVLFDTYVRVKSLTLSFAAGQGMQVPPFSLEIIDTANRTGSPVTLRAGRSIGQSVRTATNYDLGEPVPGQYSQTVLDEGRAIFRETITPSYTQTPYWNQFGQEFHIVFDRRDNNYSLGIISVEFEVDAVISAQTLIEQISIPERKYYTSVGAPSNGNNPEQFLAEMDSATGYWRSTEIGANRGGNKFRTYAWGEKIDDNQPPINSTNVAELEQLQLEEYNVARNLTPTNTFSFTSFIPFEEREFIEFMGEAIPSWSLNMSCSIQDTGNVTLQDGTKLYGEIPDRTTWSAPGHGWVHNLDPEFYRCRTNAPFQMIFNYDYAHFHDNLKVVETARFWDELPNGFTRLIRSTLFSPDPSFQGGATGGASGQTVILSENEFEGIDVRVLENAGIRKEEDGTFVILEKGS